jgi:feruloyl esterase
MNTHRKLNRHTLAAAAVLASLAVQGTAMAAAPAASTPTRCAALKSFKLDGFALQITSAEWKAAGPVTLARGGGPPGPPVMLPAHCRVDGALDSRTGSDGKPYAIKFALALPAEWNGRFLFEGGGGLNGVVKPPMGNDANGGTSALARGFAVATNDTGHSGAGFDASFMNEQEAALNFLYAANIKVSTLAKRVIAQHYGSAAHHSYFVGCSTGGREGMMMSQRFPNEFDGIVSGAPAMRTGYSNLGLRWVTTALNGVAPKDAQGRPQTREALSDADRKLLVDGFLKACDALDGARDGLVFATQSCRFDPAVLACNGAKTESCLTTEQVGAVKKAMAGARAADGRQVYPGYYYDTGINMTRGLPGLLVGPVIPEGPASGTTMNVDAEAARAHDARSMLGDTDAWTNLSTFRSRGGKLVFYHGVSDPWFSAQDTVRYYEQLAKDNGPAPVQDWSRLFLVPGMGHCAGGEATLDRFDLLDPIVQWVEQKKAPDSVVATGNSMPGQSRPLCPFPAHAQYSGGGDDKSAASYRCTQ